MQALLVVLSVAFYCKMPGAYPGFSPRPRGRDISSSWPLLVIVFVMLKMFAIHTVHSLLVHLQESALFSDTLIYFTLLPIAAVFVDHVAAFGGRGAAGAWTSLVPSISLNYILTRFLAMLAGHKIGPARGRRILGGCLMVTAMCLSMARLPRKTPTLSALDLLTVNSSFAGYLTPMHVCEWNRCLPTISGVYWALKRRTMGDGVWNMVTCLPISPVYSEILIVVIQFDSKAMP
jgi:hypothetical protein